MSRLFASDNASGVLPEVMEALMRANEGHALGYGNDPFSERARDRVRQVFGPQVEPFFVWGGTAANVLALTAICAPHEAVVCASTSHLFMDECGAPERFGGFKLLPVEPVEGKLTPQAVQARISGTDMVHRSQPRVLSVAQPTEVGTVYTVDELRALAGVATGAGMRLHIDGARLPNAAAHLGLGLAEVSLGAGADVVSLGGTKSGLMGAEAVIYRDRATAGPAAFLRKQAMQLASKMRFVAVQIEALLTDELWLRVARHGNAMGAKLAGGLGDVPLAYPVQTNAVFTRLGPDAVARLRRSTTPVLWEPGVVRWMCSFDTTPEDVEELARRIREAI